MAIASTSSCRELTRASRTIVLVAVLSFVWTCGASAPDAGLVPSLDEQAERLSHGIPDSERGMPDGELLGRAMALEPEEWVLAALRLRIRQRDAEGRQALANEATAALLALDAQSRRAALPWQMLWLPPDLAARVACDVLLDSGSMADDRQFLESFLHLRTTMPAYRPLVLGLIEKYRRMDGLRAPEVRHLALQALGFCGPEALDDLLNAEGESGTIIAAIAQLRTDAAKDTLVTMIDAAGADDVTRLRCLTGLTGFLGGEHDDSLVPLFRRELPALLRHPRWDLRRDACHVAGSTGDATFLPLLQDLAGKDEDTREVFVNGIKIQAPVVREAAEKAINRINALLAIRARRERDAETAVSRAEIQRTGLEESIAVLEGQLSLLEKRMEQAPTEEARARFEEVRKTMLQGLANNRERLERLNREGPEPTSLNPASDEPG